MKRRRDVVAGSLRFQIEPGRSDLQPHVPPSIPVPFGLFFFPCFRVNIPNKKKRIQSHALWMMPMYSWQTRKATGEDNEWCQYSHWVCQWPKPFLVNEHSSCVVVFVLFFSVHKFLVIIKDTPQAGRPFSIFNRCFLTRTREIRFSLVGFRSKWLMKSKDNPDLSAAPWWSCPAQVSVLWMTNFGIKWVFNVTRK